MPFVGFFQHNVTVGAAKPERADTSAARVSSVNQPWLGPIQYVKWRLRFSQGIDRLADRPMRRQYPVV